MVEHLNMILLTSSELYELRNNMKDLKVDVSLRAIISSESTLIFITEKQRIISPIV